MKTETILGQLAPDGAQRDAVHVAVAPCVARRPLKPGCHVDAQGVPEGASGCGALVGVVDPYLRSTVLKGQRFYICLYPRTVTSLVHHWTHPAFAALDEAEERKKEEAMLDKLDSTSKRWIEEYASGLGYSGDELIEAATAYLDTGESLYGGSNLEGEHTSSEFWDHYERLTGRRVADKSDSFFRCAC